MKTLDALKFVNVAASTDTTRPNLCSAFGNGKEIQATNGYRLHGSKSTLVGYLSPRDEQFPDTSRILPDTKEAVAVTGAIATHSKATIVDQIAAFALLVTKTGSKKKQKSMIFEFTGEFLNLSHTCEDTEIKVLLTIAFKSEVLRAGIDASYLSDVLNFKGLKGEQLGVTLKFYGNRGPLKVEMGDIGESYAIIMPMRC